MAMLTLLRVAVVSLRHIVGRCPPRRSPSRIPSFFLLRLGRDREGGGRSRTLTSSAAGLVNGSSRRLPLPCYHPAIIPPGGSDDFGCGGGWWCGAKRTHSSASQRAGAIQGTHRQQRCFFSKALCFVAGTGYTAYQPSPHSNPLKTSQTFPPTPTHSTNTLFSAMRSVLLPASGKTWKIFDFQDISDAKSPGWCYIICETF